MSHARFQYGENRRSLPVTFWYPTLAVENRKRLGIFDVSAAFDAAPAPGKHKLILLSHGSGGSDLNHHDWAEALAHAGYVVAAPRHIGDSREVNRGQGGKEKLLERPRQLLAALDAVLADPRLGSHVDTRRIGVMGFSAGCHTSLVAMGATPDYSRWPAYCHLHSDSIAIGPTQTDSELSRPAPEDWEAVREHRIGAAVLFAPFALLFDRNALSQLTHPIRLYRAEQESIARNEVNADALAEGLARRPEVITVPGGHYVFIAPVAADVAQKYPEYYVDAPGIDRYAIHAGIADEIVNFFGRTLQG